MSDDPMPEVEQAEPRASARIYSGESKDAALIQREGESREVDLSTAVPRSATAAVIGRQWAYRRPDLIREPPENQTTEEPQP